MTRMKRGHKVEGLWSIVLLELTNCCNFHCAFCPSDSMERSKSMMPRGLWEKVLAEVSEKKMTSTVFFHLMGEPLLNKDVFDAIRFANAGGLSVSLYTNGALLDNDTSDKLLRALDAGRIVISMQDIDPGVFEERCRGALLWSEYLERIQNFVKVAEARGKNTQIHCMVDIIGMGWNLPDIFKEGKKIQKVYNKWNSILGTGKAKKINVLDPAGVYPLGRYSSFFVKHMGAWSNVLLRDGWEVDPSARGSCDQVTDTFAVLADGRCTYCCSDFEGALDLGNAGESSLEDIYYGERATRIRKAACAGIFPEEVCRICRGAVVDKRTGRPVSARNIFSEYYFFKEHLGRYGWRSVIKKTAENLKKRGFGR